MNTAQKQQLIAYLRSFITPERQVRIAQALNYRTRHVTVVMEDIFQSHNANAVVRSAEIFGIQDIHVIEVERRFKITNTVSMGSCKWLDIHRHQNVQAAAQQLKSAGYRLVATLPHASAQPIEQLPLDGKIALIFGTENCGLTDQAIALADEYVTIPMFGFTESFNVSVSAALCLYSIMSRLHASSISWRLTEDEIIDTELAWLRKSLKNVELLERAYLQ